MLLRAMIAAALLTSTAGIVAHVAPVASQPAQAEPDMTGLWRFDMSGPRGIITLGAMTVQKNKDSGAYEGRLITNGGIHGLPIRSLRVQSRKMTMGVQSEHGPIIFNGELAASGWVFSGTTIYHDGRPFAMSGVKQQALLLPPSPASASR